MQLTITITIPDSKSYDIRLDDGQHIVTTLQVLGESIQGSQWLTHGVEVRVKDTGRTLNVQKTYKDEKIYTGAELILLPEE